MSKSDIQWLRPQRKPESIVSSIFRALDRSKSVVKPKPKDPRRDGYTWNPIRGCAKISPGCKFCYAENMAKRFKETHGQWGENAPRVFADGDYMEQPYVWNKQAEKAQERRLAFLGSLMDIGERRADLADQQDRALRTAKHCRWLDFALTTKRPEGLLANAKRAWEHESNAGARLLCAKEDAWEWPANCWPMVTCEGPAEMKERTPAILELAKRAKVIALSLEPLLDDVTDELTVLLFRLFSLRNEPEIWLIWGGENGMSARECNLEWIRNGIKMARRMEENWNHERGLTPAPRRFIFNFVKQLGTNGHSYADMIGGPRVKTNTRIRRWTAEGGDPMEWPKDLRIREWPGGYPADVFPSVVGE
jgi:protein gp37